MGYTTITTGTVISSTWGNEVRDQLVTPFTTAATRDSTIVGAAKKSGQVTTLTASNTTNGIYVYNGTNWRAPWNLPWGVVDYITYNTDTITVAANTYTEIGGGSDRLNITSVTGRLYKLTFNCAFENTDTNFQDVDVQLYNGSASFRLLPTATLAAKSGLAVPKVSYTGQWIGTLTAGSQALNVCFRSTTAGVTTNADTTPATFILEDIGPSGTPT